MRKTNLALRPFLQAVTECCRPLTREELLRVVLGLAEEVAQGERSAFLARVAALLPKGASRVEEAREGGAAILGQVAELGQEIKERIAAIEEGSFVDEDGDYGDYQDDYDADFLGEAHKEALVGYFAHAGRSFTTGDLAAAKDLYACLFDLLQEVNEQNADWLVPVAPREARARYCRSVYELAPIQERVAEVVVAMEVEAKTHPFVDVPGNLPLLRDLLDARPGEAPEFAAFFPAWEQALADKGCGHARLAALRLEAAAMRGGVAAVATLAREWRAEQPKGYLAWLTLLDEAMDGAGLRDAAQEALAALPVGEPREAAARFLVAAAVRLKDQGLLLSGRREVFNSLPNTRNLLPLLAEADRQQLRGQELAAAIAILLARKTGSGHSDRALPVKALLMAGRLQEAQALVALAKPVGWSYDGAVAVVFAALLHLVVGDHPDFTLIRKMLLDYADQGGTPFDFAGADAADALSPYPEIIRGLALVDPEAADLKRCLDWAKAMGEARINHIVANKQRAVYDRAARVLGALAEACVARGDQAGAEQLLRDYYQLRYNRHAAFRKEVKAVVSLSPALGRLHW
jgi:hypothetical protein